MHNHDTFKKLMISSLTRNDMPDIEFTDNSVQLLGTSVEHLTMSNMTKRVFKNTPANINTAINEYAYTASNMVDHYHDLRPIKAIADAFANQLYVGIKSLSNIKRTVNRLTEEITAFGNKMMAEDPVLAVTMEHQEEPQVKFDKVNWDKLNEINESVVFAKLNASMALQPGQTPDRNTMQIMINRLPFGTIDSRVDLPSMKIDKKAAKATRDAVYKKLSNVSMKDVQFVLTMLFDLDEIKCRSAVNTFSESLYDPTNINSIIQMARDFTLVLDQVNDDTLMFSASTKKELMKRRDILRRYADMATYISSFYRASMWSDSILLPGNRINPDNWNEFRKKGGTSIGLKHHLSHFYSDIPVPSTGVTVDEVIRKRDQVISAAKEEAAINLADIDRRKKSVARDAFIYVTSNWLKKNRKRWSPQFSSAGDHTAYAAAVYDGTIIESLESALYKLILNSCCVGTITSQLYKNMTDMYTRHLKVGGMLTDEQKEALDLTVYSNMVTEFMLDKKMIEVKN
jgi:hypothetical protein